MATLRITSDGDPYPVKAGDPLANDGSIRLFADGLSITDQVVDFTFKYRAGSNTSDPQDVVAGQAIGVTVNGVPIFPFVSEDSVLPISLTAAPSDFQWNTVGNPTEFQVDPAGGRPENGGAYRYRSGLFIKDMMTNSTFGNASTYSSQETFGGDFTRHNDGHSKIIGYALDGYPIYGPYGYTDATDNTSGITQMTSSYRQKDVESAGRVYTYAQVARGSFVQDHEYVETLGTLDQHNGRYCVTPDYTTGTYAYFLTFSDSNFNNPAYPYIIGPSTREQRTA